MMNKTAKPRQHAGEALLKSETSKEQRNLSVPAIQYDRYQLSKKECLTAALRGMLLYGMVVLTFYRSLPAIAGMVPAALIFLAYERRRLQKRRLEHLAQEFAEGAQMLAAALSAGYSIENAFTVSIKEMVLLYGEDGLMVAEMRRMEQQIKNNHPVEQVLLEFGRRSGIADIKSFGQVFAVAKKSGGQLAEILRSTAEVLNDKKRIREEIITMTAAKRFEQRIMNLMPFIIIWYMALTSPAFSACMYQTAAGRVVMTVCLLLSLTAFFWAEKILSFEI